MCVLVKVVGLHSRALLLYLCYRITHKIIYGQKREHKPNAHKAGFWQKPVLPPCSFCFCMGRRADWQTTDEWTPSASHRLANKPFSPRPEEGLVTHYGWFCKSHILDITSKCNSSWLLRAHSIFFFNPFYFVLEYSRLTMLWWFQVNSEGTQPHIYMYPFSPKLPSHLGYPITLSRVFCAMQ